MANNPKRDQPRKNHDTIRILGLVRVAKENEHDLRHATYTTATVNMSAWNQKGRRVFESFGIISIPDGDIDTYQRLRIQLSESFRSHLRAFFATYDGQDQEQRAAL